jgi:hypothetical protein
MKSNEALVTGAFSSEPERSRVVMPDGSLNVIKMLALALMTLDHCNKYLWGDRYLWAFELGRLAMPLFAFVLAYNLARPDAFTAGTHVRVMQRLAVFGALATPLYIALGGVVSGWWPLNILFTLLVATLVIFLLERGSIFSGIAAAAACALGGLAVEFWWYGIAYAVAVWRYCKTRSISAGLATLVALASLGVVNHNLWALATVPLIVIVSHLAVSAPRLRWFFYAYYPAHLAGLLMLRRFTSVL